MLFRNNNFSQGMNKELSIKLCQKKSLLKTSDKTKQPRLHHN